MTKEELAEAKAAPLLTYVRSKFRGEPICEGLQEVIVDSTATAYGMDALCLDDPEGPMCRVSESVCGCHYFFCGPYFVGMVTCGRDPARRGKGRRCAYGTLCPTVLN